MTRLHALLFVVFFVLCLLDSSIFYCYALYCFHSSTPSERFGKRTTMTDNGPAARYMLYSTTTTMEKNGA